MIRFIRRYGVRVLFGIGLVVMLYWTMCIHTEYRLEKAIADEMSSHASVHWRYSGPNWIPQDLRRQLPWFDRIHSVTLFKAHTHVALYRLQRLAYLEDLTLDFPNVTDFRLNTLQGLSKLKTLNFVEVQLTEHKIGSVVAFSDVHGMGTQTTPKGRARLRKALPNCTITPDP